MKIPQGMKDPITGKMYKIKFKDSYLKPYIPPSPINNGYKLASSKARALAAKIA